MDRVYLLMFATSVITVGFIWWQVAMNEYNDIVTKVIFTLLCGGVGFVLFFSFLGAVVAIQPS